MAHSIDLDELGTKSKRGEQPKRSIPMVLQSKMRAKEGSSGEGKRGGERCTGMGLGGC